MNYTNAQIAANLNLWNEYFNVDAAMDADEFDALGYDARLSMLEAAFGSDVAE